MEHTPHKPRASSKSVLKTYWRHTREYPWAFTLLVVGSIGIQIADLASPWFLRQFLNLMATHTPAPTLAPQITIIVLCIGLVSFFGWVMRRTQSRSIMYLEMRVITSLYTTAFDYLLKHSNAFFASNFAGSLTSKVGKFARAYEALFDSVFLEFFPTAVFVLGAITILWLQHPIIGVILALWSVLFVGFQIVMARRRLPARAARAAEDTKVTGALADAISNQATVALFSGYAHESSIFRTATERLKEATLRVWYGDDAIWGIMGLMVISINAILLFVAGRLWLLGMLTLGDIILLQSYLLGTFDRLFGINRVLRRFYDTLADAEEMVAILELPHGVADTKDAKQLIVKNSSITFTDVSFHFHTNRPILSRLDLSIAAGQRIALVGPSGAGKSTITRLLLRLYDIQEGSIEIDGQDIAKVTQDSLRDAIAFVPQEPVLFHRSLMDNIRYGRRDASDEEVVEAAKQAHCHEFISGLADGYNTFVGERGVKLSGGERQRVAIARAILKNAPILVLDEATSSLDSESEHLIQDALATLMQNKTVLVIAHRLSTIMKMDRIIVLEGGTVVADGTHDELLSQGGLYHKLWSIQAGGFIVDDEE